MRNQWLRLLLLRRPIPSQPYISQVKHLRSFTSTLLHPRAPHVSPKPFSVPRRFTSSPEPAVEPPKPPSDQAVLLADIFANPERSNNEIKVILADTNAIITHDLILSILGNPNTDPYVAKRVFDWVSENLSEKLSSESYNLVLGILGGNGLVKETWDLIGIMKEKGYVVSEDIFVKISERFQKDGLNDDVEKLKELYDLDSAGCMDNDADEGNVEIYDSDSMNSTDDDETEENDVEEDYCRVSDIIKREVWGDDVEKQLQELDVEFSSDLVTKVLTDLKMDPNKALIFFRWVEESGVFKHDQQSFNAIARVLGEEDHSEKFWRIANEMRNEGHEMERETYVHVLKNFVEKNMLSDAVDLYEFATDGGIKPSEEDCIYLLEKIVASEELDMDLFSRVLGASKANGNAFLDTVGGVDEGDLDEGSRGLRKMVEKGGASYALEVLISAYCRTNKPYDGYKLVSVMVNDKGLSPSYATYRTLTKGLLALNHFKEALDVMSMIKNQGHPPYLDPFVEYLSKTGSAEDAIRFTRAVTTKRYPANDVVFRLFEAYITAGRLSEAQALLSKCPKHIKNHADVLNLFSSGKSREIRTEGCAVCSVY